MFGLTHYLLFQQSISLGSDSILRSESVLMQLNIEPLIFIAISFFKSLKIFIYSLIIYFAFHLIINSDVSPNIIPYPFLLIVLGVLSWSFTIIFGTLTVFYRDLKQLLGIVLYILMYFTPVVYTSELYPSRIREILLYNPLASLFSLLQWSMFGIDPPSSGNIAFMIASTVIVFFVAHKIYRNRRLKFTKAF
jgi:lipopolysaccharide transport system permease protein